MVREDQEMTNEREIGEHGARLGSLEDRFDRMEAKVDEILKVMHEGKGGYKTLILMAGIAGSLGALVGKFLPFLNIKP